MTRKNIQLSSVLFALFLPACADNATKECENGQIQCTATHIFQVCEDSHWVDQSAAESERACPNGDKPCTGPQCQPQAECTNNAIQCSATGIPQICTNGKWTDKPACASDMVCKDGYCAPKPCEGSQCPSQPECTDNAIQCSAVGIPQVCANGKWTDKAPCNTGEKCSGGICKENQQEPASCDASQCKTATSYKGNICVDRAGIQSCGCNADKDCNAGYACDTLSAVCELKCSDTNCAAQTDGYQGNVCISQTDDGETLKFCGCNEDKDCKSGYTCNTAISICTAACSDTQCAAKTKDYSGDICVKHVMDDDSGDYYIECGCHTDKDCREGYTCNTEFSFCAEKGSDEGACKPEKCTNEPEASYHGNACVILSGGIGCGCDSDKDCRPGYICNYMSQCIIENDLSECTTDADCAAQSGSDYYGNKCLVDSFDGKNYTFCGCAKDADCKSGYQCDKSQDTCMKSDEEDDGPVACDPAVCQKKVPYYGSACVDYYGYIVCGCDKNADCKSGYHCTQSKECVSD